MKVLILFALLALVAAEDKDTAVKQTSDSVQHHLTIRCRALYCPVIPAVCRQAQYDRLGCRLCDKDLCTGLLPGGDPTWGSSRCPIKICSPMPDICRRRQYDLNGCRICDRNICTGPVPWPDQKPVACIARTCPVIRPSGCALKQYDRFGCRLCDRNICIPI